MTPALDKLRRTVEIAEGMRPKDETPVVHTATQLRAVLGEADALWDIISGRTEPPTDAEIRAHGRTGGAWLVCSYAPGRRGTGHARHAAATATKVAAYARRGGAYASRWWAIDAEGRPCAWPVVAREP